VTVIAKTPAPLLTSRQFTLVSASVLVAVLPHVWRLSIPFAVLILLLLVGRWAQRTYNAVRIPAWIKLPLIVLFPVLVVLHYGNVFGREPGSALACAMLVLKLIETETRRDARAAISFSSFVLMSALLFDSSLGFALLLFAALTIFLATLRELEPRSPRARELSWRASIARDFRAGAFALVTAIPLALCVFLFFPRLESPLWGAPTDASARTGLGDRMAPGTIQDLLIDDSPAFRVTFDGPVPPRAERYWRGPVLWQFDGSAWTRPEFLRGDTTRNKPETTGAPISYEVTLEPTDRRWLLALDVPVSTPPDVFLGADMSLVSAKPVDQLLRYSVRSALHYKLDAELGRMYRRLATELPVGFNPRAVALAQQWRRDLHTDDAIIRAALSLFHEQFYYTLAAPLLGRDSVDDFLFETRKGFCEHFASSFTFLMRSAGIPARVVTGYQGGYYNEAGNYLVVRQSEAHAWSEVWLEGRGWIRIDPTGSVSPERVQLGAQAAAGESARWYQAEWLLSLRNEFDLINRGWNDLIVQFNALRQRNLLSPFGIDRAEYYDLVTALIGSCCLLLGLWAWWVLRQPRSQVDTLDRAYLALCSKLQRVGLTRDAAEGPMHFGSRVAASAFAGASRLLAQYVNLRYACALPSEPAVRDFDRAVRSFSIRAR
jgi:protein-glutamine gamma-glutamyltransferase